MFCNRFLPIIRFCNESRAAPRIARNRARPPTRCGSSISEMLRTRNGKRSGAELRGNIIDRTTTVHVVSAPRVSFCTLPTMFREIRWNRQSNHSRYARYLHRLKKNVMNGGNHNDRLKQRRETTQETSEGSHACAHQYWKKTALKKPSSLQILLPVMITRNILATTKQSNRNATQRSKTLPNPSSTNNISRRFDQQPKQPKTQKRNPGRPDSHAQQ
jgi:hypothetical protein